MSLEIYDLANMVNIREVVSRYVPLKAKGGKHLGLCPFHNDRHLGSFVVFPSRGKFKCYACGEGGDGIDFVSRVCGISPYEAAITIAAEGGLITAGEAEDLCKNSRGQLSMEGRTVHVPVKNELLLSIRSSESHLDQVYQCFVAAADALTPEFKEHLLRTRGVKGPELENYFTFPSRADTQAFWVRFREELERVFGVSSEDIQNKLLLGVPGFFLNENMDMAFPAPKQRALGIIVRNRKKLISGIQTRLMGELPVVVKEGKEKRPDRYKFLSSGFADGGEDSFGSFGCGCGYVEDVLYPKVWNHAIAVTEGRFKARALSELGFLTVNMHSISNWSPAGDVAVALAEKFRPTQFLLVYDSEDNQAVFKSAQQLCEKLQARLPVEFAVWDPMYGKGFDDVVLAGHMDKISRISPTEYFKRHP